MGNALSYCDTTDPPEKVTEADAEPQEQAAEAVEAEPEAEPEEEPKKVPRKYPKKPKFWTPPDDPRFRSVNQSRACYTRYNEFYKCKLEKGEDDEECRFYKRCYESICPNDWIEHWEELREEGLWGGRY